MSIPFCLGLNIWHAIQSSLQRTENGKKTVSVAYDTSSLKL